MQWAGALDQERIGTASRRRQTCREEKPRGGRKFPGQLVLLELEGEVRRLLSHRHGGTNTIKRLALQVVQNIFRRVVVDAPTHKSLVAHMDVHVVQRRHDGLPGEVDTSGSRRRPDGACAPNGDNASAADDECPALNWGARVTDDQTRAFIDDVVGLGVRGSRSE